jgi:DNA replication protein DnaC
MKKTRKRCSCGVLLSSEEATCFSCSREKSKNERDRLGKFFPVNLPPILKMHISAVKNKRQLLIPIEDEPKGYYIFGDTGVGKSYQAACVLIEYSKALMKKGYWVNVPQFLHGIKKSFSSKEPNHIIETLSKVSLLCLDDLGSEQDTQWVMQTLYLIINNRYENMLTTIITSNLNLSELAEKMEDDRLASRIVGMCKPIHLTGDDRRKSE